MPYNDPAIPVSLEREIRDLKSRIRALERRNSLQKASANQADGTKRIQIGEISHPYSDPEGEPDFGIIVRDGDATPVFMVDSGGALIPGQPMFLQNSQSNGASAHTHTSSSWTDSDWNLWFVGITGTVVSLSLQILAGTGITSAEARLQTNGINSGDVTSEAIALTCNNTFVSYTWHFDIGADPNPNDTWSLRIETRITGGSGTLNVFQPRWGVLRSAIAIATNVDAA